MPHSLQKNVITVIRFYRNYLSHLKLPSCRFTPTCSEYALEAVERYGAAKGLVKAIARVFRCHPGGGHGYDPVVKY